MIVARSDEVAAVLASRFRLASVTLGGRVSRPGTLQGGWRAGKLSAARHMMARKLRHDMLQVCPGGTSRCEAMLFEQLSNILLHLCLCRQRRGCSMASSLRAQEKLQG